MMQVSQDLAVIILAAGKGSRMKSSLHKVLHPVAGRPMVGHLLHSVGQLNVSSVYLVVGDKKEQLQQFVGGLTVSYPIEAVEQTEQHGTGHAVAITMDAVLKGRQHYGGHILVLYGDVPFIAPETIEKMIQSMSGGAALSVLGFEAADPASYGRLIKNDHGGLEKIVEYKDATEAEKAVTLCNSGMMVINGQYAYDWLSELNNDNASGEYYLTDLVEIARSKNHSVAVVSADEQEVMGVNSRVDLAAAEAVWQQKKRREVMMQGVSLIAPETVFFTADTEIAPDVVVEPNVVFGPNVQIETGAIIKAFSHLEGVLVRRNASVGPYARLRPGSDIGEGAKIGNFVETKKAKIHNGAKVSHLSYVGDAEVGEEANIGAGTITCNYDGFNKAKTTIGAGAFIGSNTALVAPVTVQNGAIIGAGSVITKSVNTDDIALTRAPQKSLKGAAKTFREKAIAKKNKA